MKSAPSATHEEVIPPLHVLEAAQTQDRKEAEDLLAGFDRPGRSPKLTPKERDFVDYYARKKSEGGPESGSSRPAKAGAAAAAVGPRQIDVATVIKARKRDDVPPWFVWTVAAAFMLLIGGVIAYLGTEESRPSGVARTAPSAPTTITASPFPRASTESVPPPDPVAAGTTTTPIVVTEPAPALPATDSPPRGAARRDLSATPSGASAAARTPRATGATDGTKPPPRDDFIRDL